MEEALRILNLEIGLFVKGIKSFSNNFNKIDKETDSLLLDALLAIQKLRKNVQYVRKLPDTENNFLSELNGEPFQWGLHIVCTVCYEHIPFDQEDLDMHKKKNSHRINEIEHSQCAKSSTLSAFKQSVHANQLEQSSCGAVKTTTETGKRKFSEERMITLVPGLLSSNVALTSIVAEVKQLCSRDSERVYNENQIFDTLKSYTNWFDSKLVLVPIGSSTFGFGSKNTNFNIAINTSKSRQTSGRNVIHLMKQFFMTTDVQTHFRDIVEVGSTRALGPHLKMIHRDSGIECTLLMDDGKAAKSSKIIRDFMNMSPLCRYLVFYFQAWQNVLHNELAAKGYHMFRFNTYLSSALIIFYLQMERNLPKIDDLRVNSGTSTSLATADGDQLHQITYHLFHLYGHRYQIWNHIISAQVGRWQQQYMQSHEKPKKSPLPQYRLRAAIQANRVNWPKGSMHVQDFASDGVNIAAEIPIEDAEQFQMFCQIFASQIRSSEGRFRVHFMEFNTELSMVATDLTQTKLQSTTTKQKGQNGLVKSSSTSHLSSPIEIDQTDRIKVTLARGFPLDVEKTDIRNFFSDSNLLDDDIYLVSNDTVYAYINFASQHDHEEALKKNGTKIRSQTIYTSEIDFFEFLKAIEINNKKDNNGNTDSSDEQEFQLSLGHTEEHSNENSDCVVQVQGLPASADKRFIVDLFSDLKIDEENGIQFEGNQHIVRTGIAYVKFENVDDFQAALNTKVQDVVQSLKIFPSTDIDFWKAMVLNTNERN